MDPMAGLLMYQSQMNNLLAANSQLALTAGANSMQTPLTYPGNCYTPINNTTGIQKWLDSAKYIEHTTAIHAGTNFNRYHLSHLFCRQWPSTKLTGSLPEP